MKALEYFGVASQQVTQHGAHVLKIEGQFLGNTADRYLQVHDSVVAPAANAVPLRQWPIAQLSQFFQTFSAGELSAALGLFVCVSNTDGTYTQSADTMDLTVELTDPEVPTGTSFASDLNTANDQFTIWADGAGPKKLVAIEADGTGLNQDAWLTIVAQAAGAQPPVILGIFPLPIGKTYLGVNALRFGKDGRDMFAVNSVNGSAHNGCYVYISVVRGALTPGVNNHAKIRAEYK